MKHDRWLYQNEAINKRWNSKWDLKTNNYEHWHLNVEPFIVYDCTGWN